MRALQVTRHGSPEEVLRVVEVAVPDPGPRQVRIRVAAGTLNHNDIDRCRGKLVTVPTPPPFTLGMEVCGVVEAAGPGGEAWVGRRVVAITQLALGGLAERAIAPIDSVFEAPPGLDDADAVHAELLHWLAEGRIRPVVGRRVPLEGAAAALLDHEARCTTGRTVVLVGG